MSKHAKTWDDWLPIIAGVLFSGGAIGSRVYGGLKSRQLETIAASLAGGIGVYFATYKLLSMFCKSKRKQDKPTSFKYDPIGSISTDDETALCERFANVVNELDRKFDVEARKAMGHKSLDKKTFTRNIQKADEESFKMKDMVKRLEDLKDLNLESLESGGKPSTFRKTEICSTEEARRLKAKFREELFSYINELKGYVQGTIDPLPSARKIQFRSTELRDEIRGQAVMIVKEYANSILPRLEKVIDEFVDSGCISKKILENKVKESSETLGVSEKDLSMTKLMTEMKQFCSSLENETKSKSQTTCQFCQQSKKPIEVNMKPFVPTSVPYHLDKVDKKTSERSAPVLPKRSIPPIPVIPLSKEPVKTPGPNATKKPENTQSNMYAKLTLSSEEMDHLNLLKSEL